MTSYHITGKVADESGAPISGANLTIYRPLIQAAEAGRTATDGSFSLDLQIPGNQGSWPIAFLAVSDHGHHLAIGANIFTNTTNLDLRLLPTLSILVKARDQAGNPVTNAKASLSFRFMGNTPYNLPPAKADGQGVMRFDDLAPGQSYQAAVSAAGYGRANVETPTKDLGMNPVYLPDAVLQSANLGIEGMVLLPNGKPLAQAAVRITRIQAQPANQTTLSDDQGHFKLNNLTQGTITVQSEYMPRERFLSIGTAEAQAGDTNVVIRIGINNVSRGLETRIVTTTGKVVDASGAAAPGVRIVVYAITNIAALPVGVRSEADGTFSITWQAPVGLRGASALLIARDLDRHLAAAYDLNDLTTELNLRLQPALTLSVHVRNGLGASIDKASSRLSMSSGAASVVLNGIADARSQNGVLEIGDLPQGRQYSLIVSAPHYLSATLQAQAIETTDAHFQLPDAILRDANRTIAGVVVGADDLPVAGVRLRLTGADQPNRSSVSLPDGRFTFTEVGDGPAQISASVTNYAGTFVTEALGGDTNVVFRLVKSQ